MVMLWLSNIFAMEFYKNLYENDHNISLFNMGLDIT